MNINKFTIFCLTALISFTVLLIHKNWFFSIDPLVSGDWAYFFTDQLKAWGPIHSLWMNYESLGRPITQINQTVLFTIFSWLAHLGFSYEFLSRIFFFIPIAVGAPLTSYLFLKEISKSTLGALLGTSLYTFNSYFFIIQGGHMHLSFAYALAPLVYYFLLKNHTRYHLLAILTAFIISLYEIRMAPIILLFGLVIMVFSRYSRFPEIPKLFLHSSLYILLFGLLSTFWIIVMANLGESTVHSNALSQKPLNWITLINALTLHHPFWSNQSGAQDFIFSLPSVSYFVVTFFAFFGLLVLIKENAKVALVFLITIVASLFMLIQENGPLAFVYQYLQEYTGVFGAFRESSKFFFFIAISYSVAISYAFNHIFKNPINFKSIYLKKYYSRILVSVFLICVLAPAGSFLAGKYDKTYTKNQILESQRITNSYLLDSRFPGEKVLWVSRTPKFAFLSNDYPGIDGLKISEVVIDKFGLDRSEKYSYLNQTFSRWLVSKLGISHMVVYNEEDPIYKHYGNESASIYTEILDVKFDFDPDWNSEINHSRIFIGDKPVPLLRTFSTLYRIDSYNNFDHNFVFLESISKDIEVTTDIDVPFTAYASPILYDPYALEFGSDYIGQSMIPLEGRININNLSRTNSFEVGFDANIISLNNSNNSTTEESLLASMSSIEVQNSQAQSIQYKDVTHDYDNKVTNPSFNNGLWKEKVSDCNNYDDFGEVSMSLSPSGYLDESALLLSATRHVACTSLNSISMIGGRDYLLSFKFKGSNAEFAGFYLGYNDSERSYETHKVKVVKSNEWEDFGKVVSVPEGATEAALVLYSYETGANIPAIILYDEISLREIPASIGNLFISSQLDKNLSQPKSMGFDLVNPTKKLVHIKGATTPFYLAMSESYHPEWQAQFNNEKINGFLKSWIPFVTPDRIPDEHHFELNGFLNGWYIDTPVYCEQNSLCTKNPDGSYDIELVLEFFPQRWFYLGLLISGTTFVGMVSYLLYDGLRRRRVARLERARHHDA